MILVSEASYAYRHADVHCARHAIYLSHLSEEDCDTNLKNVCVVLRLWSLLMKLQLILIWGGIKK